MSERATLDETALAGLPPRVQTIARNLALTNPTAARKYIEGQQHQANADEGRSLPNSHIANKTAPPQPKGNQGRTGLTELAAKAIKLTIVLDAAAVAAVVVPDGVRPRISVTAGGRRLTAELNPKTLRKTIATIREHGPDNVAVVLQGKLAAGDVIEEGATTGQVKTPKPVLAPVAAVCPPNTDVTASAIYKCHWGRAAGGRGAPGAAQRPTGARCTAARNRFRFFYRAGVSLLGS